MKLCICKLAAVTLCASLVVPLIALADGNAKSHQPARAAQPQKPPTYTAVAPKQPTTGGQHGIIFVGGKNSSTGNAAINSQPVPPGKSPIVSSGAINSQPVPPGKNPPINIHSGLNSQSALGR